ncbi:MAG: permease-like cell division protein FtsX, partial [Promicromonosporaceae bacterium]|nr:permease-like cell division protein FtsX [Promicromonosporaceae bacterium]
IVMVTFISLAFVGTAALIQKQVSVLKGDWYDLVEVSVYFCPSGSLEPTCAQGEATEAQISNAINLLNTELPAQITSITFQSKAEALEELHRRAPDGYQGMQLTEEDMQASLKVKLADPEDYELVSEILTGRAGIEEVVDQRAAFRPLFNLLGKASLMASGIAAVMLLTAGLLIATTIKLSAVSRREETSIMRLVGASNGVIYLPFLLEGAVAALLGAALAVGALYLGVQTVIGHWFANSVTWIAYIGPTEVLDIAPLLASLAVGLAIVASLVSLRRYTQV